MPTHENTLELTLFGRADCGLCDRLETLIRPHLRRLCVRTTIRVIKRDITDHPQWHRLYHMRIPVLMCAERVILEGRPEPEQIADAFAGLADTQTRHKPNDQLSRKTPHGTD